MSNGKLKRSVGHDAIRNQTLHTRFIGNLDYRPRGGGHDLGGGVFRHDLDPLDSEDSDGMSCMAVGAQFIDDTMILHFFADEYGETHLRRYRVCRVDGQELVPGVDKQETRLGPMEAMWWKNEYRIVFLDHDISTFVDKMGIHVTKSEALRHSGLPGREFVW
jgi:hypothetical protein